MNTSTQTPFKTSTAFRPRGRHILLALSLPLMVVGYAYAGGQAWVDVALPLGAILFGVFLILTVTEKEMDLYVQEEQSKETATILPVKPSVSRGAAGHLILNSGA